MSGRWLFKRMPILIPNYLTWGEHSITTKEAVWLDQTQNALKCHKPPQNITSPRTGFLIIGNMSIQISASLSELTIAMWCYIQDESTTYCSHISTQGRYCFSKSQYKDSLPGHLLAQMLCFSEMACTAPDLTD